MLPSVLLCPVHIPHEAPDSKSTFGDFASDECVCPRGHFALVADTAALGINTNSTPGINTDSTPGANTDSRAGAGPVADTATADQRIAVWSSAIVSGRTEGL